MSRPRLSYRPDIDGLRALAVLSVLLFHLDMEAFSGGYTGVDVFFVISGFLITSMIVVEKSDTGRFDLKAFYIRRVRRLFPAFIFTVFLAYVGAVLLLAPHDFQRFAASAISATFSLSNLFFWSESGYFDTNAEFSPLLHTWSLSVEEQFYLIWPLLLIGILTFRGRKAALYLIGAMIVASFLLNILFDWRIAQLMFRDLDEDVLEKLRAALFFLTPFRVFELGLGASLAFLPKGRSIPVLDTALFLIGLALIGFAALSYTPDTPFPSYNALVPCIGAACVLYAHNPKYVGSILDNRVAVGVGLISYSLYLIHWPLIAFMKYWKLRELDNFDRVAILVVSFILASAMYAFVEQPFRRRGNILPGCAALLFLCAILSVHVWENDGWPWRLNRDARQAFEQVDDPTAFHRTYYGGVECRMTSLECTVNVGQERNVYFVGDSHSRHYAHGLSKILPDFQFHHIDNRCLFNTLTLCVAGRWQDSEFFSIKVKQLDRLKMSDDKVILSQAWGARRPYYDPRTKEVISFESMEEYVTFLAAQLVRVDAFLGSGRLIVVGEVNRFGRHGNPLSCLSRPFFRGGCERSEPTFASELNRRLGFALRAAGIPFIDPSKALCDDRGCVNLSPKQLPLYSDAGHLSVWGSEYVVGRLREEFEQALGEPAASPPGLSFSIRSGGARAE